jgi:hypothetical protein
MPLLVVPFVPGEDRDHRSHVAGAPSGAEGLKRQASCRKPGDAPRSHNGVEETGPP